MGTYHDFSTNEHGDLIALVMREKGLSFSAALDWLKNFSPAGGLILPAHVASASVTSPERWSRHAQAIWDQGTPLAGTIAESYLRKRQCYVPNASELRLRAGNDNFAPAIIARVTDFLSGDPLTLHFTRLDSNGKIETRFLSGHEKRGGVIRLLPIASGETVLGVAEGLETALSVICGGRGTTWAALDAGNLGGLPCRPGIVDLRIWADNDPAGLNAAKAVADRYAKSERSARIIAPEDEGADWNDVVRGIAQ
jgi:phage/plasmid primase-like uncharacterized protein